MNRRDFLDPRQLAHTAGQILAAVDELPTDEIALLRSPQGDGDHF